ncbi:uncharacterized protein N7482_005208 [Penicillium canariense]|uniref:U4/U6.U5 small nuclear ribonucleoprotein 27kDa protein domain-containing protein n=1 Tax=Penicillium canariense TaxID=189055 RepID=A0A9W9I7J4_9EURO|nr:uncharacterized protein N7482_005208 [Penicillium canariense]KAJ5166427.1 hypothetical protein N7482_005208 [Penicillium canariense]
MAEPPAKRARRVDSSVMWDMNDSKAHSVEPDSDHGRRRSPPPEMSDAMALVKTAFTAHTLEIAMIEGEKGAGLEIAATETEGTGIKMEAGPRTAREVQVGSVVTTDEVSYAAKGDKIRDRSRSPARNGTKTGSRSRSPPSRGYKGDRRSDRTDPRYRDGRQMNGSSGASRLAEEMDIDFKDDADEDQMEAMMRKSMGFTRFRTTKNTKVPGNDIYGVRKEKTSEYRQYMNRTGGFNRPLSPSR